MVFFRGNHNGYIVPSYLDIGLHPSLFGEMHNLIQGRVMEFFSFDKVVIPDGLTANSSSQKECNDV